MTTPPPQGQNPYPQQQPPPPAPMGQQPYPGFAQGAPVPPPQAPKRNAKKIIRVVIALVVVVVAAGAWYASRDDANTASVGDCMHRGSSNDNNPDLEVVDCTSSKAQFKVLAKINGSYSGSLAESKCEAEAKDFQYAYTETGGSNSFLLCLKDYEA